MTQQESLSPFVRPALLCAGMLAGCTSATPDEPDSLEPRSESTIEIAVHGECLGDGISLSIPTVEDHPPDPGLAVEWSVVEGPSEGCLVGDGPFARLAVSEPGVYVVEAVVDGNADQTAVAEVVVESCDGDPSELSCLGSIAVPGGEALDPEEYGAACECPEPEPADTDGDGITDAQDRCPDTVLPTIVEGCSVAQLLARPDALTHELAADVSDVEADLQALIENHGLESLDEPTALAAKASTYLHEVEISLDKGDACEALESLATAKDSMQASAESFGGSMKEITAYAVTLEEPNEEAVAASTFMVGFDTLGDRAAALGEALEGPAQSLGTLCDKVDENATWKGRVVDTVDARGVVRLEDGRLAALPWTGETVAEGMFVTLNGDALADTLIGTGMEVADGFAIPGEPKWLLPCLELGYAPPIQRFDSGQPADVVHDPGGYQRGSWLDPKTVHFEEGGRLTAVQNNCEDDFAVERGLRITGIYGNAKHVLAEMQRPSEEPLPIQWTFNGADLTGLDVELVEQDCSSTYPCLTTVNPTESYPVNRVTARSACELELDREVFELHQTSPSFYQRAVIDGYEDTSGFPSLLVGTNAVAHGEGYRSDQWQIGSLVQHSSTYPNEYALSDGDGVAVYEVGVTGFVPWWAEAGPWRDSPLRWPHVTGLNGIYEFSYSCEMPTLIRDRIADCGAFPALMDTYYALPFGFLQGWLAVTQGNLSPANWSHAAGSRAQFGFDFDLPMTSFVLAARPGKVIGVFEDEWRGEPACLDMLDAGFPSCGTDPGDIPPVNWPEPAGGWGCVPVGNIVVIEHDDGTRGVYVHFNYQGIFVNENDRVERGDILGFSGTTGCSTGPHLHFEQQSPNTPNNGSEPITYGGYYTPVWPPAPQYQACWNPVTGSIVQSTLL